MGENNHFNKTLLAIVIYIASVMSAALPVMGVSPCGPLWSPNAFGATGANDTVYALVHFDPDGDGPQEPAVIVGGGFSAIGATSSLNKIARRDADDWAPMGIGLGSTCFALAVFDEDALALIRPGCLRAARSQLPEASPPIELPAGMGQAGLPLVRA